MREEAAGCGFLPSSDLMMAGKASQLLSVNNDDNSKGNNLFSQKKVNITIKQKELY